MGCTCNSHGKREKAYRILVETLNERTQHLKDLCIDARIV